MKVLVTGGAGFIGSALVRHLITNTAISVVVYDKLTYAGNLRSLESVSHSDRYCFVQGDIADSAHLREALATHQPHAVINLAAESHVDRSIEAAGDFIQTNLVGTFSLLEAVRAYWGTLSGERHEQFRLLHVSTDEVYGDLTPDAAAFTESHPYRPSSPYSASKAGADHLVRAWQRTHGLPSIISCCSNNYGPFQFPEKLIPHMILSARSRRPLPIYGSGQQVRDWIYVDDHVSALLMQLRSGIVGETYHVGGNNQMANVDVVNTICEVLGEQLSDSFDFTSLIEFVRDRPGHDLRYAMDTSKIQRQLGWAPMHDFHNGLKSTIHWYLQNDEWCQAILSGEYRLERKGLTAHE